MTIIVLTESEIRSCVTLDQEAVTAVAEGFSALAEGRVTLPPILRVDVPEHQGEVDVKTAYIQGLDGFAIKIAAGFWDNERLGLPTGSGMMVIVSARTGRPEAVLLDNGYLTDVRTAAAGAIAARHLARKEPKTAGIIGAGMQARYQLRALKLVRDFERVYVFSLHAHKRDVYVREMSQELGVEVVAVDSAEQVVRQSDVVVTTTPAHEPFLRAAWLHPGLHITSMGSDAEEKQEIEVEVFANVDRIVCDSKSQSLQLGELHHAAEAAVISAEDEIIELGQLTSGQRQGRQAEDEITICDLTGVGVQDTQIALLAFRRARDRALGLEISG